MKYTHRYHPIFYIFSNFPKLFSLATYSIQIPSKLIISMSHYL